MPLDTPRLLDTLFEVHGLQLFRDGFFNGDPHPGNIMLLDDGRLGLIDWGQVKTLGLAERLRLARLIVALAARDSVETARRWADCGFRTEGMHPWALNKWACWRFSRMTPDVTKSLGGPMRFEMNLGAFDAIASDPQPYVMAFRLAALLRGNAMGLGDMEVDSAKRWLPHARALLKAHGEEEPHTVSGRELPFEYDLSGHRLIPLLD